MTRKSKKLRSSDVSSFSLQTGSRLTGAKSEVDYCGERFQACRFAPSEQWFWWPLIRGFISRELSVIGIKVSFRNCASRFILYCVLIQKS